MHVFCIGFTGYRDIFYKDNGIFNNAKMQSFQNIIYSTFIEIAVANKRSGFKKP